MSEENTKTGKELKSKGFFYKFTEGVLGIASVGALVLSFIPGANIIGAIIQGAITLVQTAMDLVTNGIKKAVLTFATGVAFTAVSFVPFLGAAGKATRVARGLNVIDHAAPVAAEATAEATGFWARAGKSLEHAGSSIKNFFKPVTTPIADFFKWTKDGLGKAVNKIPGVTKGVDKLKGVQAAATKSTEAYIVKNPNGLVSKTADILSNDKAKMAAEVGLMGASVGLGMMGGNTTPPNVLANPDLYSSNKSDETPDTVWAKRIEAERASRGPGAPSVA